MARRARIEYEGAFYHVIVRGNQRQKIFKGADDFQKYLEILSKYKERYNFVLYAFVLMGNHIHLLIETQKNPLSKILQGINQSYTMYFNKTYSTVGHLFQGRYKAILCDRDDYLLALLKYIHHNPMRAGIVKAPDEYRWSSHLSYARKAKEQDLVEIDSVLRMFSEDKAVARKLYRAYIGDDVNIEKSDVYCTVEQRILGDEEFIERTKEKTSDIIASRRGKREYTLAAIAAVIEERYGFSLKEMRAQSKSRDLSAAKSLMSLVANEYGYKNKEIAEFMRRDPVAVTRHLKETMKFGSEIEDVINLLREKKTKCQ